MNNLNKNIKANQKIDNDIMLSNDLSISYQNKHKYFPLVTEAICLICCVFSILLTLKIYSTQILLLSALISLFVISMYHVKKYRGIIFFSIDTAYLIAFYLFRKEIRTGMWVFETMLVKDLNRYYNENYVATIGKASKLDSQICALITLILGVILVALMVGYALVRAKGIWVLLTVEAPFCWMSFELANKPRIIPLLFMLVAFLIALSNKMTVIKYNGKIFNNEFNWLEKKRTTIYHIFDFKKRSESFLKIPIVATTFGLAIILTASLIVPKKDHQRPSIVNDIINNPQDIINIVGDKFEASVSSTGIQGGGKLGNIKQVEYQNQVHLKVQMDKPTAVMLKGYVGSIYKNNSWSELNSSDYNEYKNLFKQFKENKLSPQNIGNHFIDNIPNGIYNIGKDVFHIKDNSIVNQISVENVQANKKFIYRPYYLFNNSYGEKFNEEDFIYDSIIKDSSKGKKKSTTESRFFEALYLKYFTQKYGLIHNHYDQLGKAYDESKASNSIENSLEKEYRKFVQDKYTQMPQNGLERLKAEFTPKRLADEASKTGRNPYLTAIGIVTNRLKTNAVYDLSPGATPSNEDFIEYFYYKNRKGYCVHFATAGTMMFRAMGIPARYVEGYTLPESFVNNNTINVTDQYAHAWTEIYVPYIGWTPVEVTPGFTEVDIAPIQYNQTPPEIVSSEEEQLSSEEISSISENEEVSSKEELSSHLALEEKGKNNIVRFLFIVFLIIILLLIMLAISRIFVYILNKKLNESNHKKVVQNIYSYIIKMFRFKGYMQKQNQLDSEFYHELYNSGIIDADRLKKAFEIAQEARFSNHTITNNEVAEMLSTAKTIDKNIYSKLKFSDKLKYMFIYHLR